MTDVKWWYIFSLAVLSLFQIVTFPVRIFSTGNISWFQPMLRVTQKSSFWRIWHCCGGQEPVWGGKGLFFGLKQILFARKKSSLWSEQRNKIGLFPRKLVLGFHNKLQKKRKIYCRGPLMSPVAWADRTCIWKEGRLCRQTQAVSPQSSSDISGSHHHAPTHPYTRYAILYSHLAVAPILLKRQRKTSSRDEIFNFFHFPFLKILPFYFRSLPYLDSIDL